MDVQDAALKKKWDAIAAGLLVGRTIKAVGYASDKELDAMGWDRRPLVIELDNGLVLYPSQDDEGNGPGALFTTDKKEPCLPVL